jgi:hypothetical protein
MTFPKQSRDQTANPFYPLSRMEFPAPSRYRSANWVAGPDYWQQQADYKISATLDTAARSIKGSVQIRYTNNSPDALRYVWLQLDQNLYRPAAKDRCCSQQSRGGEFEAFRWV